jgi:thiol-disulfide isomerase/thioredoxin
MRFPRVTPCLLLLTSGLCGCTQTGALRTATPDNIKTTASVGDKSLPVVAGTPGGSVRADTADPDLPRTAQGRISGRVYDEEGLPVPNAMVRLAVGADPGGKAVFAKTDRSGAFTLRGLRPGSGYTVIAEYQGEQGMMSGRADADAPDTDVRIGLHLRDAGIGGGDVRTAARPNRSSVKSISKVKEVDEDREPEAETAAVNREDLVAPAADDAVELSRGEVRKARAPKTVDSDLDRVEPRRGWSSGSRSSKASRVEEPASPVIEDDGELEEGNPLPPAIEIDQVSDRREQAPVRAAARSRNRKPAQVVDEEPPADAEALFDSERETEDPAASGSANAPRPLPDGFGKGNRAVRSQAFAPLTLDEPEARLEREQQAPARSRRPRARTEQPPDEVEGEDPQASQSPKPTWSELAVQAGKIPLDEAIEKTTARSESAATVAKLSLGAGRSTRLQPVETTARRAGREGSLAPSLLPEQRSGPFCDFDATDQRLIDFALPDTTGRMVSIRGLDADLVLLDFWGTWCDKCRTSIPHLTELQSKLGGKRLQVVGVACEQTPAKERAAKVADVAKKLGVNYTVLVTAMDGTCPVQEAFQIRFYPTMILLDRNGRILCRQEGATAETLGRIDRYIARNLDRDPASPVAAVDEKAAVRR